jgi:uncharacterized protein
MTSLALPTGDLFSIVTTSDRGARSPSWKSLLNWPRFGDTHIDYATDTPAQRNLWAARLDEAVLRADRPVLLVASGESCFATAWWARLSPTSYVSRVAGALLFTPLKRSTGSDAPEKFASPRVALPFPSAIVNRAPDDRLLALAENWGSRFLDTGWDAPAVGDTNAWQAAQAAVMRLTALVVERDMRVAGTVGLTA